ncbi:MAG: FKBP-type peptidyl-prolyl cis-trans isomerase [Archangium sp.]
MLSLVLALLVVGARQEPGTVTLKNGTIVKTVKEGTGPTPGPKDVVSIHFRARLPDDSVITETNREEKPTSAALDSYCPCIAEGLQRVKSGGAVNLVCPPSTTEGAPVKGKKVPKGSTVVIEVELFDVAAPK